MREIVFYKVHSDAKMPVRKKRSAGYDVCSIENYEVYPGQVVLVRTGLVAKVPFGHHLELFIRSSFPIKNPGLILANGVGLIDEDFCGPNDEICVEVLNTKFGVVYNIEKGQRIAQLVLRETNVADVREGNIEDLKNVESRGSFGSTGE